MNAEAGRRTHATWRYNGVHIWGWSGDGPAPAGWLLSGFGGRSGSPLGAGGDLTRIELPGARGGPRRRHVGAHVTPGGARLDRPAGSPDSADAPSASLVWFGQVGVLAARLIAAGRVLPALAVEHGRSVVRWTPVLDDRLTSTVAELADSGTADLLRRRPRQTTTAIVDRFVDALARQSLDDAGWWPDVGRRRDPRSRARHAVIRALAGNPGIAPHRQRPRSAGVRRRDRPPRRRVAPCRASRPWISRSWWSASDSSPRPIRSTTGRLELQLADEVDPGRWCTAADVWDESSLAVDLAGGRVDRLDVLRDALTAGAEAAGDGAPGAVARGATTPRRRAWPSTSTPSSRSSSRVPMPSTGSVSGSSVPSS